MHILINVTLVMECSIWLEYLWNFQ